MIRWLKTKTNRSFPCKYIYKLIKTNDVILLQFHWINATKSQSIFNNNNNDNNNFILYDLLASKFPKVDKSVPHAYL